MPPRVAAIHDLAGFGKCALSIVLPTLGACGIEACPLPTALLSSHAGIDGFTFRDLSDDIVPTAAHWAGIGVPFDAVYSGYLGSPAQVAAVLQVLEVLRGDNTLVLVDPVMGDNGRLYRSVSPALCDAMRALCRRADVLLPNVTEACLLLGRPYLGGPHTPAQAQDLLQGLLQLGPKAVVLTGLQNADGTLCCAAYDNEGGLHLHSHARVAGHYHGTGDLFASVLCAALLHGRTLQGAMELAADYTHACIARTAQSGQTPLWGVHFEQGLARLGLQLQGGVER